MQKAMTLTQQLYPTQLVVMAIALFVLFMAFMTRAEASTCPDIPNVSWWGNPSVETMTTHVDAKYDGDWTPYIELWEHHEQSMRDILSKSQTAVFRIQGVSLQGNDLQQYVEQIKARVDVIRCVADRVLDAQLIKELSEMETAAGAEENPELDIRLVD